MNGFAWESSALSFNPFDGDYDGDGGSDAIISDKIVTCRKTAECHTCGYALVPATRVRRRVEVYDGQFMRFAWCEACCVAMAADDFDKFEERVAIGDRLRAARKGGAK
jgi:hypothetical protein